MDIISRELLTIKDKYKIKNPLIFSATIIIITVLLLVSSSGCATKEPTIINQNNVSQTTLKESSAENETSVEEPASTEEASTEEANATITTKKPDIEIIHPARETNWQENIGGIAKNIPDGYQLWILVYSQEKNQYYPYSNVVPQNDQWVIKSLTIGFKDDYHKNFDIIAVLADKKAQSIFNDYLNTAKENEENIYSQGLYLIPEGAKEYDRITLSRVGYLHDNTVS